MVAQPSRLVNHNMHSQEEKKTRRNRLHTWFCSKHVYLENPASSIRHLALGENDGAITLSHRRLYDHIHLAEVIAKQVWDSNSNLRRCFGNNGRRVERNRNRDVKLILRQDLQHLEQVISTLGLKRLCFKDHNFFCNYLAYVFCPYIDQFSWVKKVEMIGSGSKLATFRLSVTTMQLACVNDKINFSAPANHYSIFISHWCSDSFISLNKISF